VKVTLPGLCPVNQGKEEGKRGRTSDSPFGLNPYFFPREGKKKKREGRGQEPKLFARNKNRPFSRSEKKEKKKKKRRGKGRTSMSGFVIPYLGKTERKRKRKAPGPASLGLSQ